MGKLLENQNVDYTPAGVLAQATGDVMDNIFDVKIVWPEGFDVKGVTDAEVSYRCDGFNPPDVETKTYDITWHGIAVKKVAAGVSMTREFTLQFRLSSNYLLYMYLVKWSNTINDVNTGGVGNSDAATRTGEVKLIVPYYEYNSHSWKERSSGAETDWLLSDAMDDNSGLLNWHFKQVQCVKVSQPKFKNQADGKSQNFEAKFIFGDVYYPFYGRTAPGASSK